MLDFDRRRALDPQYQRAGFPPILAVGRTERCHWIFIGSLCAAMSGPTISAQRVTNSAEAKPCRVKASPIDLADDVAQRLGKRAGGLVHGGVLCHPSAGAMLARS